MAESVICNSFKSNSIFQMPFLTLFVEELVEIFMADETFVFFGRTAHSHRSMLFPKISNNKLMEVELMILNGKLTQPCLHCYVHRPFPFLLKFQTN